MGRTFGFQYDGRRLSIRPVTVDEGWELWVMDGERRLECAARVSIDDAVIGGRSGQDIVRLTAEQALQRILSEGLEPGPPPEPSALPPSG